MRKLHIVLLLAVVGVFQFSCQKEVSIDSITGGGTANNDLIGTWKFLYLHAKTNQSVEATDGVDKEKIISVSEYFTKNNGGTLSFDATKMTGTGFAYSIDTIVKGYFYLNDILIDSVEVPFFASIPPSNSVGNYKLIGTDSLYFESGGLVDIGGSGGQQTIPGGAKFKIENGVLTLTQYYHGVQTETDQGVVTTTTNDAFLESFFQKQ